MAKSQPKPIRYEWKPGRSFSASPVVAHNAIELIRKATGAVTPAALVDASRAEDSPLHGEFTWDDTEAAEAFRRTEARQIMNHLVVVYRQPDTQRETRPTRAYIAMRTVASDAEQGDDADEPKGYTDVQTIMQDPQLRRRYIVSALREIAGWRRRHADIVELSNLFAAIDPVLLEYGVEVERVQATA